MKPLPVKIEKILIRSTNWIGDAVMTTPVVRSIRQNYPDAHITLLALPWVADVFSACPHIDQIFVYDKKGIHKGVKGRLKLVSDLRAGAFDITFLLQNAFEAALITTLAAIPARAGYTTDGRRLLLTHPVKKTADIGTKHQVHYYQQILTGLGLGIGPDTLELFLDTKAVREAEELLDQSNIQPPFIGLNPGAAYGPAKRWPAEKYGKLAKELSNTTGGTCLIFGTDADQQTAEEIAGIAGDLILDLTGKTSLSLALALIDRCQVFITNDSGLMHVAAALQTPLVAVFGSTDHIATGPYSDRAVVIRKEMECSPCMKTHCPEKHFKCMQTITVQEVAKAAHALLTT